MSSNPAPTAEPTADTQQPPAGNPAPRIPPVLEARFKQAAQELVEEIDYLLPNGPNGER